MKKYFNGDLKYIDSERLVSDEKEDLVENFFITLGLFFNDLKGFFLFHGLLENKYEKPKQDEVTVHAGNYSGVLVQINKLITSAIHEFFNFLEKNQDILDNAEFNEILDKLPKQDKELWIGLFAAARGDIENVSDFLKAILKIRNNVGFHYCQSGKLLRNGYKSFFDRKKRSRNKFAYYAIGETIETTRFFFSDAAVEEAMQLSAGKKLGEESNESLDKYTKQFIETINILFPVIVRIFDKYVKLKRNLPK